MFVFAIRFCFVALAMICLMVFWDFVDLLCCWCLLVFVIALYLVGFLFVLALTLGFELLLYVCCWVFVF